MSNVVCYQYALMYIILLCGVQIANIWLGRSITEVTYIIIIAQHTPTSYVGQGENGKSISILGWSQHEIHLKHLADPNF